MITMSEVYSTPLKAYPKMSLCCCIVMEMHACNMY